MRTRSRAGALINGNLLAANGSQPASRPGCGQSRGFHSLPESAYTRLGKQLCAPLAPRHSPAHSIMKKFLTALFCLSAFAAGLSAASGLTRESVVTQLDSCEAILQEIQGNTKTAIPADI